MPDTNYDAQPIDPVADWPDVPMLSTQVNLRGGPDGPLNAQAIALTARTKRLEATKGSAQDVQAAATAAQAAVEAANQATQTANGVADTANQAAADASAAKTFVEALEGADGASRVGYAEGVTVKQALVQQASDINERLRKYPLNAIPTTDVGDIHVNGLGEMFWDSIRQKYVNRYYAHGQCRFIYESPTACRLIPFGGNGLIIDGRQYRIPASGVAISNAGLTANATYYIYAKDNGNGGIALEARSQASLPHATYYDGVETGSPDTTRTLVGMVAINASTQFVSSSNYRYVISWFNQRIGAITEPASNNTTASTTYVKLQNGCYTLMWNGGSASIAASGIVRPTVAGGGGAYMVMSVNGISISGGHGYTLSAAAASQQASVTATSYIANADGVYNFAPYGFTGAAANPVTFYHDVSVMAPL